MLALGPNYATERNPKHYSNELIIDIEYAVRQLDPKIQNAFHYIAATKIKQISETATNHNLHRRYQYNVNQIKNILHNNNPTLVRADKNKAIVIIEKDELDQKVQTFIWENNISQLNKDPTESHQKQIQHAV
jgi:hypothetical protein